jgi:hypothetical protein
MDGGLEDGNMSPYYILNNCSPDADIEEAIPSGFIAAFDNASCPSGWSEYSSLAGRSVLASGSGNLDRDGGALSSRSVGNSGGREFTSGIPVVNAPGNTTVGATNGAYLARHPSATNLYSSNAPDDYWWLGGDDQSNFSPYYSAIYCSKN